MPECPARGPPTIPADERDLWAPGEIEEHGMVVCDE